MSRTKTNGKKHRQRRRMRRNLCCPFGVGVRAHRSIVCIELRCREVSSYIAKVMLTTDKETEKQGKNAEVTKSMRTIIKTRRQK